MENLKRRGRQVGQTKTSTFIKDELLEPYFIEIDERSFNVMDGNKMDAQQFCAAFSSFENCIKKIIHYKISDRKTELSLKGFIQEYKKINEELIKNITL